MQIYLAAVSRAGRRAVSHRWKRIMSLALRQVPGVLYPGGATCNCYESRLKIETHFLSGGLCMLQVLELADWVVPACTAAPLVGELNPANTPFSAYPLYGKRGR